MSALSSGVTVIGPLGSAAAIVTALTASCLTAFSVTVTITSSPAAEVVTRPAPFTLNLTSPVLKDFSVVLPVSPPKEILRAKAAVLVAMFCVLVAILPLFVAISVAFFVILSAFFAILSLFLSILALFVAISSLFVATCVSTAFN